MIGSEYQIHIDLWNCTAPLLPPWPATKICSFPVFFLVVLLESIFGENNWSNHLSDKIYPTSAAQWETWNMCATHASTGLCLWHCLCYFLCYFLCHFPMHMQRVDLRNTNPKLWSNVFLCWYLVVSFLIFSYLTIWLKSVSMPGHIFYPSLLFWSILPWWLIELRLCDLQDILS